MAKLTQENKEKKSNLKGSFLEFDKEVICVDPNQSVAEAAKLMRDNHIGDVVVAETKNGKTVPVGMITDRDITIETCAQGIEGEQILVSDIMTKTVETALDTDDVFEMIRKMKEGGVSRLPIVDKNGDLKSIVTAKTLFKCLVQGLDDLSQLSNQQKRNELEARH